MTFPALVVHSDWSTDPRKRWVASAALRCGVYHLSEPKPADADVLIEAASREAADGNVIFGFDFPIGVPRSYAVKAQINSFVQDLPTFGTGRWSRFYDLAVRPEEISVARPFYPARPGGTEQRHLVTRLGLTSMNDLLRRCDLGVGRRNKACALFWTLGGNQVGRAAIAGWREVVVPALRSSRGQTGVWPFDGDLSTLLTTRSRVIVETYPADACIQLGLAAPGRGWSKRNQRDRVAQGRALRQWASSRPVELRQVESALDQGFGPDNVGEDRFDALVGLLGMLDVLLGRQDGGDPDDNCVRTIEGWIFGQPSQLSELESWKNISSD